MNKFLVKSASIEAKPKEVKMTVPNLTLFAQPGLESMRVENLQPRFQEAQQLGLSEHAQGLEQAYQIYQDLAYQENYAPAYVKLGLCLYYGMGHRVDKDVAAQLIEKALTLNLSNEERAEALRVRGQLYETGYMNKDTCIQDARQAADCYREAFQRGDVISEFLLDRLGRQQGEAPKQGLLAWQKCLENLAQQKDKVVLLMLSICNDLYSKELLASPEISQRDLASTYRKRALEMLENLANQGIIEAQYILGLDYTTAFPENPFLTHGDKDDVKALSWFEKALHLGHREALYAAGLCYIEGKGASQDETKGWELIKQAAERGYSKAQVYVGKQYKKFELSPYTKNAFDLFVKADQQGDTDGSYQLALLYQQGFMGSVDPLFIFDLFLKGAEKGHLPSLKFLGKMRAICLPNPPEEGRMSYQISIVSMHKLTVTHSEFFQPDRIRKIEACLEKCTQQGLFEIKELWAPTLNEKKQTVSTFEEIKSHEIAASQGLFSDAIYRIANLYRSGCPGLEKDNLRACVLYETAANLNHGAAALELVNLAPACHFSLSKTPDDLLEIAARQNMKYACLKLVQLYEIGECGGLAKNAEKAFKLTEFSASYFPEALSRLADCYAKGIGTSLNEHKAFRLRLQAAHEKY
jgi:TPR repeat protein